MRLIDLDAKKPYLLDGRYAVGIDRESARPKGEWYYNYENGWHCSICHEIVKDMPYAYCFMREATYDFCPNCGADMRKGEEE